MTHSQQNKQSTPIVKRNQIIVALWPLNNIFCRSGSSGTNVNDSLGMWLVLRPGAAPTQGAAPDSTDDVTGRHTHCAAHLWRHQTPPVSLCGPLTSPHAARRCSWARWSWGRAGTWRTWPADRRPRTSSARTCPWRRLRTASRRPAPAAPESSSGSRDSPMTRTGERRRYGAQGAGTTTGQHRQNLY